MSNLTQYFAKATVDQCLIISVFALAIEKVDGVCLSPAFVINLISLSRLKGHVYEATKRVDGVMDLKLLLISYTIITFAKDASATNLLNIDYLFACYSCISHPLES